MCGISGIIDLKGRNVSEKMIYSMNHALNHRGPDGEGIWVQNNVGIGHTRLSILDLSSAGSQPMIMEKNRYILSFNGEISNFVELKEELIKKGLQFISQTDTEVLLKLLIIWGSECLKKLNGLFSFAFYDSLTGDLIIARDRYGAKPLYYTSQDGKFIFASEQKALKGVVGFESTFDNETLVEYLTFQNIFTNKTFETKIKILEPGHFLQINTKESYKIKKIKYWDFEFEENQNKYSEKEYIEELDRLINESVERNLRSDVEIGCYLSGGMDSGTLAAIASSKLSNLKTFTVGFDLSSVSGIELSFDETSEARSFSKIMKTKHYEKILKSGDMERILPKLLWHLEEPRMGQSYPNFYAAELAGQYVKVVFSGAGGDELFGGYPWRYYRSTKDTTFDQFVDDYYEYWQRIMTNEEMKKILRPIYTQVKHVSTKDIFKNVFQKNSPEPHCPEDFINHCLYFEAKTFLHGLLIVEDKISMAHNVETRIPFLDNEIVDFSMKIPVRFKIRNLQDKKRLNENDSISKKRDFFEKNADGKYILRKTMQKYIPEEITMRRKKGFSAPDATWYRGPSIDYVKNEILNKNNQLFYLLDYNVVYDLLEEHFEGRNNRRLLIWSLLNLQELLRSK